MTQAAKRTSTRTRRTSDSQPTLNGRDPQDLVGDRDDDNERDGRTERDEQDSRDEQSEQRLGDRGELGDRELGDGREPRREPNGVQRTVEQLTDQARAATSHSVDAFAGAPDMSKVVTAWFDMAGNMMKLQQQFFTTMLEAGNTNDRPTTKA